MAFEYTITDTPEDREERKRKATLARIRILAIICVICVTARLLIKNPPPPKAPDRTKEKIRYVPGMLDQLPNSALEKMDPKLLAQIRVAETNARQERLIKEFLRPAVKYKPADVPLENAAAEEEFKQLQYVYIKKRQQSLREQQRIIKQQDLTKPMLILFRRGGFVKAERSLSLPESYRISMDQSLTFTFPKKLVSLVSDNGKTWQEPIPKGQVRIKPAKGITVTVAKETAKRITMREPANEG